MSQPNQANMFERGAAVEDWTPQSDVRVAARVLEFPSEAQEERRPFLIGRKAWKISLTLAAIALLVRLAVMPFLYQENLDPERNHWMFGHEQGRVARSIALGHGFSDPLFGRTGPTAYTAPVYPYILAAVFKICGIYSRRSAIVIIALNCVFSAATVIPLYFFTRKTFGELAAFIASAVWVVFPYSVYWTVMRIWDTWISTLLLAVVFWLTLELADSDRVAPWAGYGLLWGLMGLLNPVALAVLPGLVLWMVYSLHRQNRRWLRPAAAAVLCAAAIIGPWLVRDYYVFHRFIPIRDNLGLELYVGNDGNDERLYDLQSGPWKNQTELERFRSIGEVAYFEEKGRAAAAFIEAHPAWYAVESVRRFINVWTDFWSLNKAILQDDPYSPLIAALCTLLSVLSFWGLWRSLRNDAFAAIPYAIILLFYPLLFCFTHTADWYRRPIDPFFIALSAYALSFAALRVKVGDVQQRVNDELLASCAADGPEILQPSRIREMVRDLQTGSQMAVESFSMPDSNE